MNTVLIVLANLLTAALFPAMSVTALETFGMLAALAVVALSLAEYSRPVRRLPALESNVRVKRTAARPAPARALTAA